MCASYSGGTPVLNSVSNPLVNDLDADGNDLTNVGAASVGSVDTEEASITNTHAVMERNTTQDVSSGTRTKVDWDQVVAEDAEVLDADTANDSITILKDGVYLVHAIVPWDTDGNWSTGNAAYITVNLNGSVVSFNRKRKISTNLESAQITYLADLSVNDMVDIRVEQDSGSTIKLEQSASENRFEVVRLG